MAKLTKTQAARQLHISRTTLYKLIDEGKLSATPDGLIDTAELVRVMSTDVDNNTDGPNGLPSVTSTLTIQGAGADTTVIERQPIVLPFPPQFRLLHVAATGGLTLERLTIRGGGVTATAFEGGGLFNRGVLAL